MTEAGEFDANDPVDAIADSLRTAIGDAMLATVMSKRYLEASPEARIEGLMSGAMVGVLGGLASITLPGCEAEMRATLLKHMPFWFDAGLDICGRPRLGEIQ